MQSKSNYKKLIVFCIFIISICGISAFFVKEYLFEEEQEIQEQYEEKEKYEYNEFVFVNITSEVLIQRYFVDFKYKMLNSTEEAYKMLDGESKKVYKTYADFKNYIDSNYDDLSNSYVVGYDIKTNRNTTNYIISDQFGNTYTFKTKAVLVYTVNLNFYNENSSIFD